MNGYWRVKPEEPTLRLEDVPAFPTNREREKKRQQKIDAEFSYTVPKEYEEFCKEKSAKGVNITPLLLRSQFPTITNKICAELLKEYNQ